MRLLVGHQRSQFWPVLVRFMDYYPPFWGPRVVSTIDDPRDAFKCMSSTETVWANSEQFPECLNTEVRLRVGHQHSQFWTILARFMDHYSPFWGPGVISTIDEPGARLHVSHQHSRFLSMLTSFVDYYSPFLGSQSALHGC